MYRWQLECAAVILSDSTVHSVKSLFMILGDRKPSLRCLFDLRIILLSSYNILSPRLVGAIFHPLSTEFIRGKE